MSQESLFYTTYILLFLMLQDKKNIATKYKIATMHATSYSQSINNLLNEENDLYLSLCMHYWYTYFTQALL